MSEISCIIPVYNAEKYLHDAVQSVIAQPLWSAGKMRLYLIDGGSADGSPGICESYAAAQPGSIAYVRLEHPGVSAARNRGLELAQGSDFIAFLDADSKYSPNHINNCLKLFANYPESVFAVGKMSFFGNRSGAFPRYSADAYKVERELELGTDALYVGHIAAGLWRGCALKNVRFSEGPEYGADTKIEEVDFIARALQGRKIAFSPKINYFYRAPPSDPSADIEKTKPSWYSKPYDAFLPLYEGMIAKFGAVPRAVQQTVFEQVSGAGLSIFPFDGIAALANGGPPPASVLAQLDQKRLSDALRFIVRNTDEGIITQANISEYWARMYLLGLKNGEYNLTRYAPIPTFVLNDVGETDSGLRFGYLGTDKFIVSILEEKQGVLTVRGRLRCLTYAHFDLDVSAEFETQVAVCPAPLEAEKLYFGGAEIFPPKYYEIKIDLRGRAADGGGGGGLIRFFLKTDYGVSVSADVEYNPLSHLGHGMPFCIGDEYLIQRTSASNVLKASPLSERLMLENCYGAKPFSASGEPDEISKGNFQLLYGNILGNFRNFSKRRIWLFMDRHNETGNNAEALFRHCVKKDDGIEKYYIIPNESCIPKFAGLPFIVFGTLEYKLLCVFAEKFISPFLFDEGITLEFGIDKADKRLYEDIQNFKKLTRAFFRGDIIHIQHGVIIQDISFYLNKFNEEVKMLCCSGQKEYEYVKGSLPHAIDASALRLTGLPKFDLLEQVKNNPHSQKVILFAPSFDRKQNFKDKYMPWYKGSAHFQYVSSVIHDAGLLETLREAGYKLYFKPHYLLTQQMVDFDIPEGVTAIWDEIDRYELYAMSDAMITDYSGIAFDFAYLKKPVVYAHFMPYPKFEEAYFSYENDGFGEICKTPAELAEALAACLRAGCVMPEKYRERVDSFFSIQDGGNCERVYQEILKLPDTRRDFLG
jgi:hypothetical protein